MKMSCQGLCLFFGGGLVFFGGQARILVWPRRVCRPSLTNRPFGVALGAPRLACGSRAPYEVVSSRLIGLGGVTGLLLNAVDTFCDDAARLELPRFG